MKTKEFITNLSLELGKELELRDNKNYPSMATVWWNNQQICSVPSQDIYELIRPEYQNEEGYVHRNMPTAKAIIISFLDRWENEAGFKEMLLED